MSEEKYPSDHLVEDFEEPAKTIETQDEQIPIQQNPQVYGTQQYFTQPLNQISEQPIEEKKKKKGRTALIIIFAIILPVLIGLTGLGLLIWGLVVGFTNCFTTCGDACTSCFGCCEGCNACANSCNNCSTDCGSSCDNCTNCCGSSSSIEYSANQVSKLVILKESINNFSAIMEWYIYTVIELIKSLF
ncbi:MAG: hypothetical protein ACFFDW_09560 [Candidatus Thorarchaeota archaeon]